MSETIIIREFEPDEWRTYRSLRLRALAESPDSFGRTLAAESQRPDAEWEHRLTSGAQSENDLPLIATVDGEPSGLAWGRIEDTAPDVANLYQVWVAPEQRGKGLGKQLLETVITWVSAKNVHRLELGVTLTNLAAVQLYKSYGFKPIGDPEPLRSGAELYAQDMRLTLK